MRIPTFVFLMNPMAIAANMAASETIAKFGIFPLSSRSVYFLNNKHTGLSVRITLPVGVNFPS